MEKRSRGRPRGRPIIHISDREFEFFKVYIPHFSSNHLKLPPDFVEHFNGRPPKRVTLKNLKGQSWELDIELKKYGTYFKNGWPDFVKENSLLEGEFLIFRYNGRTGLTARVFGLDGCLKQEHVMIEPKSETEIQPEIAHNINTSKKLKKKRKERSTSFVEKSTKGMKTKSSSSSEFQSSGEEGDIDEVNMLTSNSKDPSFKIVISTAMASKNYPYIPRSFLDLYMKNNTDVINLQISDTTWELKLSKSSRRRICYGWVEFRNQNSICKGDVCVFQLTDCQNLVFKVTVCRSTH